MQVPQLEGATLLIECASPLYVSAGCMHATCRPRHPPAPVSSTTHVTDSNIPPVAGRWSQVLRL
eukprot:COSAG01_NODE_7153_length_3328_cov_10.702694_2_plen_64_part_00